MDAPPFASAGEGHVRNGKGFTLIELLVVVVIIGILAAIAIPKYANTKQKAFLSTMKSDLRNLATAEESYFADAMYYGALGSLAYRPSAGVTVAIGNVTGKGWSATATHNGAAGKTCAIYVGIVAAPPAPAVNDGEPRCTP